MKTLSLVELHQLGEWWWHGSVSLAVQVWGREWGYPQEGFPLNPLLVYKARDGKRAQKRERSNHRRAEQEPGV